MIIEFLRPHSLNMGEDFEYLATFIKGKGKLTLENCRLLVKGINSGREMFLMLEPRPDFFGKGTQYFVHKVDVTDWVTNDHAKGERARYNYYRVGYDIRDVHTFFNAWKQADPMVHMGGLAHQFVSKAGKSYTGAYKFDNKVY